MSNRFHSKYHRQNHHTYTSSFNADAGHDPIASREQPFKGDFILAGALSAYAPLSAVAGYFYSNFTALCAIAGQKGLHIVTNQNTNNTGIYVFSSGIALSAYGADLGFNVYSPNKGIILYGGSEALNSYSPNKGIFSFGGTYAGSFLSTGRALTAFGVSYGADIASSNFGINVYGGTYGGNFFSPTRGLSAYGGQTAIDAVSPNRGLNVRAVSAAVVAFSPNIALSSGGGGVNIFQNRVGIFKTPSTNYVLDVKGDSYLDGNLTVTGDVSAYGVYSYFDTKITITSSLRVLNIGTDAALTVAQSGNYPILVCYDSDISNSVPSFIVDGAKSGWVALGASTPQAPFYIQKSRSQSNDNPQIFVFDGTDKKIALGTETDVYTNPFIGTESPHHLFFNTNSSTKMTITSSGNIGIGTTNPDAKITITGGNNSWVDGIVFKQTGTSGRNYSIASRESGRFTIADETASISRIVIDDVGDIGINTSTPNERLTVSGNISSSGQVYADTGLSVKSGGITVSSGGLTVTNGGLSVGGGLSVTSGNLTITNGNASITSGVQFGSNNLLTGAVADARYVQLSAVHRTADVTITPTSNANYIDWGGPTLTLFPGTYIIETNISVSPTSTLGINYRYNFSQSPASQEVRMSEIANNANGTSQGSTTKEILAMQSDRSFTTLANSTYNILGKGIIKINNGGNLTLEFTNGAVGTQSITIKKFSYIQATKIA